MIQVELSMTGKLNILCSPFFTDQQLKSDPVDSHTRDRIIVVIRADKAPGSSQALFGTMRPYDKNTQKRKHG